MFGILCLCHPTLFQLWPDRVFLVLRTKTHFSIIYALLHVEITLCSTDFWKGRLWSANCKIIAETPDYSSLCFNLQAEIFQEFSVQEESVMFRISLSVLLDCLTIFGTSSLPGVVYFPQIHERLWGHCVVLRWSGVIPWQLSGQFYPCSSVLNPSFLCSFGCGWPKDLNRVY